MTSDDQRKKEENRLDRELSPAIKEKKTQTVDGDSDSDDVFYKLHELGPEDSILLLQYIMGPCSALKVL